MTDPTFGHLAELEPGRSEPETLLTRLLERKTKRSRKPKSRSTPFTSYHPPYEIHEDAAGAVRHKEGLRADESLFPPQPNPKPI